MTKSVLNTVLVTGASGALGGVIARQFEAKGWRVISVDRHGPRACDLSDSNSVQQYFEGLDREGIKIDSVVHCAGGFRYAMIGETTDADFDFLFNSNLRSSFNLLRAIVPRMRKQGRGRIVVISAQATQAPPAGMGAYVATKAGLNALLQSVQAEMRDADFSINALMPTIIDTPSNRSAMPGAKTSEWVKPEQLGEWALLLSDLNNECVKTMRGQLISVEGAYVRG